MTNSLATDVALQVAQQAVTLLAEWVKLEDFKSSHPCTSEYPAVTRVKEEIFPGSANAQPQSLRVLFDSVQLDKGQSQKHYWPPRALAGPYPAIPYPRTEEIAADEFQTLRGEIQQTLKGLDEADWQNLSLLTLIVEKYGSYISFVENDIALVDIVKSTTAVAAALAQDPKGDRISLVAGNLSGIQNFIYTISSDGALKSLRARSFYLELLTEEVVQQVLQEFKVPRSNVVYAGGGNLYLLVPHKDEPGNKLDNIRRKVNKWLINSFKGKLFLSLEHLTISIQSLKTSEFAELWTKLTKKLAQQKFRKFETEINNLIKPCQSYEPCRVCHRDDLPSLKPLNREIDSSPACWMCRTMFELGEKLFGVTAIVRSQRSKLLGSVDRIHLAASTYYYIFKDCDLALAVAQKDEVVFLINNWEENNYKKNARSTLLLLGNYGKRIEEERESKQTTRFIRAEEMAERAQGISRVGYLRMDVDRLGQIFAKGLGKNQNLPRLAGLSRLMSYFFKVYLNSLAESRFSNLLNPVKVLNQQENRQNLLFIYAGGDDLFVSGAWNEVAEFACDIYQCFRAYTGRNPDITISGGISIEDIKFPLYQAAKAAGEAEEAAKGNGRDSLGLFGGKFKWDEWLGIDDITVIDKEIANYLNSETKPDLWGVLPLVKQLNDSLDLNYSRSFIRNLLLTAELQEQMLEKFKGKSRQEQWEMRYYLHLPKIAYTLARLPSEVRDRPQFAPVRTSLKSPYNAPYFRAIATWIEFLNRS